MDKSICNSNSYLIYYNGDKIFLKYCYDTALNEEWLDCFINDEFIMEIDENLPDEEDEVFEDKIINYLKENLFL